MPQPVPPRKTFGGQHRNQADTGPEGQKKPEDQWLRYARDAFDTSTTFIDANYRQDWENSIRHFQSKHMRGSKYGRDEYKYRSKHFRPKTRSTVRQNEAAAAAAYFSQLEIISIDPKDELEPLQKMSAALRHEILNERLTEDIPWYQLCTGGMQNASVYGVVASKQDWDFKEVEEEIPLLDAMGKTVLDEEGNAVTEKRRKRVKDKPRVDLRPIENIRFDPAADWTDVVNSSPYFIDMIPTYVGEVREMMAQGTWQPVADNLLMQSRTSQNDTTRQEREGEREDPNEARHSSALSDFDTVWVHENFIRIKGKEWHYYTLGTVATLTKPRALGEVYLHNIRPHVVGTCVIEANRVMPDAPVHMAKGLQKEANEVSNTRLDNVKLALNKRYIVKRGKQVDLQSLVRNAPASVTLANDPELDVKVLEFNDVTASAYAEQDRINNDMDELLGSFSQGSVNTNRKLNETVGGMQMLRGASNQMTQYLIRTFTETWVQKVIRQLDLLEQHYEDDVKFLALMARRADFAKYQVDTAQLPPEFWKQLLMQPATILVNVANSAMDPAIRLQMFLQATDTYAEIAQKAPPDLDLEAVKSHIFGLLGFRDGRQFSTDSQGGNPQLAAAMQQIQQLTQQLEGKYAEARAKQEVTAHIEGAKLDQKTQSEHAKLMMEERLEMMRAENERLIEQMRIDAEQRNSEADRRMQLMVEQMKQHTEVVLARVDERARAHETQTAAATAAKQHEVDARQQEAEASQGQAEDLDKKIETAIAPMAKQIDRLLDAMTQSGKQKQEPTVIVVDGGTGGKRTISLQSPDGKKYTGTVEDVKK